MATGKPRDSAATSASFAGPAAVGDDGQAVAADAALGGEELGGGEQLLDGAGAHDAGALQGGVEHVIGTEQRAGVRDHGA